MIRCKGINNLLYMYTSYNQEFVVEKIISARWNEAAFSSHVRR